MLLAELRHLFTRVRVLVLLAILFLLPVFLAVAVKLSGGPSNGRGPDFVNKLTQNGVFAAFGGLNVALFLLLPLTVAIIAGDAVAGESSLGTLRYLLTRPSGRLRLLAVKGATVLVFCLAGAIAIVVGGLAAGTAMFPDGDLINLSGQPLSIGDAILRALLAGVLVAASLVGLGAIGLFVSTMTDTPVAAMAITLGMEILSTVLNSIPQVSAIHPWLFTHEWFTFGDVLRSPVLWHGIGRDLLLQAGYLAVFGTAAWARFTSKDVLA